MHICAICNSEAAWIKQVIEIFGEDEAKAFASVESACKVAQSSEMPQLVKQAVELARKNYLAKQATEKVGIYADVPPQMPARLPKLIKLLTRAVSATMSALTLPQMNRATVITNMISVVVMF